MIIGRFAVHCRPERTAEMAEALIAVEAPSRDLAGVVHFDAARSLTDPNTFIVTEVFEDHEAFDRRNTLSEVAHVLQLVPSGTITGEYEWKTWEI
jgi:quinol monooxygenase YgiN